MAAILRYRFALGAIVLLGLACLIFPPFRIVPLKHFEALKTQGLVQGKEVAGVAWRERALSIFKAAPEAGKVLKAIAADPKFAATNYGRTVGMSDTVYYLFQGTGKVVSVDPKGVGLCLAASGVEPDLLLKTGLVFGNTVRDATGLLNAGDFPNSQDFNEVSTELNRIVETEVIPRATTLTAGQTIRFVAAAEMDADAELERPLKAVPVSVEPQ